MAASDSENYAWQVEFGLEQLPTIVATLLERFSPFRVWLLEGNLGAGKTTLVQELARQLAIDGEVTSPTFSLVNQYQSARLGTVYHLDLYRLQTIDQAVEIGLFEMVDSGYVCLIEWASAIDFRPAVPFIRIDLEHINHTTRRLSVAMHEN